ncbi:DUF2306 domain-containing protein [Paenibacillus turpanensis]|uniref:DUF2306 domain-containing protein n=1 Tax=Paenibacillus turpanensis TaxID=2689078 RepID=UPI00140BD6C3|nr:DUF2306 domain-containing protein [Paenibacillus turpanensis]
MNNNKEERPSPVPHNELGKPPHRKPGRQVKVTSGLLVAFSLILLSAIPNIAGAFRVTELIGGVDIMSEDERFIEMPLPLVAHILLASVFSVLGAFQFAAGFRVRWPGWHRAAGRIVVLSGLLVGLSALWMTLFYAPQPGTGKLLYVFRLFFGSAMVVSIYLGFTAIRRGNVPQHRAWMIRAYAIGLGAGTQVITHAVGLLFFNPPTEVSGALQMLAGWLINLAVAEWIIRKNQVPKSAI